MSEGLRRKVWRWVRGGWGLLTLAAVLGACLGPTGRPVTVQLSRPHGPEFMGFYVALEKDYYTQAGLTVELRAGETDERPLELLAAGDVTFAVATSDGVLRARARGLDLVAVGAVYRRNPLVILSLAENHWRRPDDFHGLFKAAILEPDGDPSWGLQWDAMTGPMELATWTTETQTVEAALSALQAGETNAIAGAFTCIEGVQLRNSGYEVNEIFYGDYGLQVYPNLIVTTGQQVSQKDLVNRFVSATFKGYQYGLAHPQEAVDYVLKYTGGIDRSLVLAQLEAQAALIDTGDMVLGGMDTWVWQSTQDLLLETGIVETPQELLRAYTNEFVNPLP